MLVYADTNIYCRPFDDLSQLKTSLETENIFVLFDLISINKISLITSDILNFELNRTDILKQIRIKPFLDLSIKHINQTEFLKKLASKIKNQCQINPRDSIHVASAIFGKAEFFLTCDNGILKKSSCLNKNFNLNVINPIQFIGQIL